MALVTGGGRGLGRAFAQALATAGAAVAVAARSENQLTQTVELIDYAGGRAIAIPGNVSNQRAVAEMVSTTEQQLGPVSILVNNAGLGTTGSLWEVDSDDWWRTLEVNLRGPYLCSRAVLPGMIARGHGRIINLTSGAAWTQAAYMTAISASKAALTVLTNCLAAETMEHGISVLAFAPGLVRTAMSESPDLHESVKERFQARFEEGSDTPMERCVQKFMFLASGRADALSGRSFDVNDEEDDMLRRIDEIRQDDLYTLRRRI